jgi:tRNA A-37 threonylcarbamoyl transferase component Bud32
MSPQGPTADGRELSATTADGGAGSATGAGVEGLGQTIREPPEAAPASAVPVAPAPALVARNALAGLPGHDGDPQLRYRIGALLGEGATARVFAATDHIFARDIAVKHLGAARARDARQVQRFIDEARISAALEHPNIVPIHDFDRTDDGGLCFMMRRVDGVSLGEHIRSAGGGRDGAPMRDANAVVNIVLRVAEALASAHAKGVLHRDIKPDNIVLGRFGEVMLVDWGSALRLAEQEPVPGRRAGTPLYMAPEQARGELLDARADLWALGATLFHALIRRPPMLDDDLERFWRRKQAGDIDAPRDDELARAPRRLLAIALKAMAPRPADRYADAAAMIADLSGFQAGLAVSAYREGLGERLLRLHRAHARWIWTCLLLTGLLAWAGMALWGERRARVAQWGEPVLVEDFRPGWDQRWQIPRDSFQARDGSLVSVAPTDAYARFRTRLEGATAIEFTGRMLAGSRPGDLSVIWTAGEPVNGGWGLPPDGYVLQLGAYDNTFATILRLDSSGGVEHFQQVDVHYCRLDPALPHRIRVEIDGSDLRILVDGAAVCAYRDLLPVTSGYLGLYGYYPGKEFSALRIYSKGLPAQVSPLEIGDSWARQGRFAEAAEQYLRVARAHGGSELGDEARFRAGWSRFQGGDAAAARAVWAGLDGAHWRNLAETFGLDALTAQGRDGEAITSVRRVLGESPELTPVVARWTDRVLREHLAACDRGTLEAWLRVHDDCYPDAVVAQVCAATILHDLGRDAEIETRFGFHSLATAGSLRVLGQDDRLLHRDDVDVANASWAWIDTGRLDEALADARLDLVAHATCLFMEDQPDQARAFLAAHGQDPDRPENLRTARRFDALLALPADQVASDDRAYALAAQGRWEDVLALGPKLSPAVRAAANIATGRAADDPGHERWEFQAREWTLSALVLRARRAGAAAEAERWKAMLAALPVDYTRTHAWFASRLMVPFLDRLAGDRDALGPAALARMAEEHRWHWVQRLAYAARYLGGTLDDQAFLAQPDRRDAHGLLLLVRAMRAELAGRPRDAHADWLAWDALPVAQRVQEDGLRDPVIEEFAAWRAQATAAPGDRR